MSFEIVSGVINGLIAKTELADVSIVRRLYTHGTAHCTLGTDDQEADTYAALAEKGAKTLNADVLLRWHSKDDSETVDCFRGYVRSVRAERLEHRAYFHFECVSYSARLDQIRNFRVWESCTLKDVCDYLIGKNKGELDFGEGGASATGSVKIPLSVQYEETDFAYLCRMLHAWGIPLAVDDLNRKVLIGKPSVPAGDEFPSADRHWNTTSLEAGLVPIQTTAQGTGSASPGIARSKVLEFNAGLTRAPGHLYEPKADAPHHAQYQQEQKLEDATNLDVNTVVCRARWMGGVYAFAPGALVNFAEQPWLVRDVTIQGHGSEAVSQEFALLDKLMPLLPRLRRTNWPMQCLWAHVTKNNSDDPTKSGRIQVEFDWEPLEATPFTRLCWLQTVTPYGGLKGKTGTSGFLSLPEVGEHVLVQFLDGWDSDAVVIGSVREHAAQGFVYAPDETKLWRTPSGNLVSMTTKDKGATDIVEIRCKDKLIFRGEIEGGKETVVMDLTSSGSDRIHFEKGSGPAQLDIFCSGSIYMHADNQLMLEAGTIQMKATKGTVKIDGTPLVMINCGPTSMSPLHLDTSLGVGAGPAGGAGTGTAATRTVGGMAVTKLPNGDTKVGRAITIHGTPAFQAQALDRLDKIATTDSGMQTLNSIDESGHNMKITEYPANDPNGPNSDCGPDTDDEWQASTAVGKPVFYGSGAPVMEADGVTQRIGTGTGADTTVRLLPDLTLTNSLDPAHPVPNDAILFHEMTHGAHQMNGIGDCAPDPVFDTLEEKTTISTGTPSEADYLRDIGYPYHRVNHSDADNAFVPNTPPSQP